MSKEKNVFVSHYSRDEEHIQKLRNLLATKNYSIKNSSIDSAKRNNNISPEAVRRLLRLRIQWAKSFICLIGPETHTRQWVNWEIEQAAKKGKVIIGVFTHGSKEKSILPEAFVKYGDMLTGWNSDKVARGLEGEDIGWSNADGLSSDHPIVKPYAQSC